MIPTPISLLLALSVLSTGEPVRGRGVEARTASVFSGACHYGAESTTSGREALLAWRFDSGFHRGIDLAGLEAAAAIAGDRNLADPECARRSVLYVDGRASPEAQRALADFLRTRFPGALGTVLEERQVALRVDFDSDRYRVSGGDLFEMEGVLLADRACCKMPSSVWYRPLTPLAGAIVGHNASFRFADRRLGPVWDRPGENAAFAGSFEFPGERSDSAR